MTAALVAIATFVLCLGAELLHGRRTKKVRHLAFGPGGKLSSITLGAAVIRILALTGLAWSLTTLLVLPSKVHRSKLVDVEAGDRKHLLLVLDVSPSMHLKDTGVKDQTRTDRASQLVQSLLERTTDDKLHITMVAVYNGAKPVVQESRDMEVILNFLDGLPLHGVFKPGKTRLFDGLEEAARIAKPWPARSTTLLLVSDGDTVPASGMPKMPSSIGSSLVLGVGDPTKGTFIDGHQSRQDIGALQQIAARLGGSYHNGNLKHIPTDLLAGLGTLNMEDEETPLTLREYALILTLVCALALSFLPVLLYFLASPFKPAPAKSPALNPFTALKNPTT